MRTAAELLHAFDHGTLGETTTDERLRLSFALGARDLEAFRLSHDPPLSVEEAILILRRRAQQARPRPSWSKSG